MAFGGKHSLGYKSFYAARQRTTPGEIVGILLLKTDSSDTKYATFITTLSIGIVVLLNLGLRGLFRTGRNWQLIRGISVNVKANELRIAYLAVSKDVRDRQVGKQLLEFAKRIAIEENKDLISLFVREKNTQAQRFFLSQGFFVEDLIPDEKADSLLGQGASIRMIARVETSDY